jgi:hypothetical protein
MLSQQLQQLYELVKQLGLNSWNLDYKVEKHDSCWDL